MQKKQRRNGFSIAYAVPLFKHAWREESVVSKRTEMEGRLLDTLETQAGRLCNIEALLDILLDSDIFAEGVCKEAKPAQRLQAVRMLESIADLARFYHHDAMRIVQTHYHPDG